MTAKQYDAIISKLIAVENRQEIIISSQLEILSTLKSLNSKTVIISDVNKEIEQLKKDVKSLQDEGVM